MSDNKKAEPVYEMGGEDIPQSDIDSGLVRKRKFSELTTMEKLSYLSAKSLPVYVVNRLSKPRSHMNLLFQVPGGR